MATVTATDTAATAIRPRLPKVIRTVIVALASAALAVTSGLAAFAQAGERLSPQHAAAAFSPNGGTRATLAVFELAKRRAITRDPFLPPSEVVAKVARAAQTREPLDANAIALLGAAAGREDPALGLKILRAGHAATRRSSLLNTELLAAYGRVGEEEAALRIIDEILRRQTAAHGPLLERMATLAGDRRYQPMFLELLSLQPPWAEEFWRQVAQSPAGLQNAAALRQASYRQAPYEIGEVDRMLIEGLAGQGRYQDAASLARTLFPDTRALGDGGPIVRNDHFSRKPDILPFDWRLLSTADFGAGIDTQSKALTISALGGSRGVVAEQLVAIPPRTLKLIVTVARGSAPTDSLLSTSLTCAGSGRTLFKGAIAALPARIAPNACRWAWLRLEVSVPREADGYDWIVQSVSLTPDG